MLRINIFNIRKNNILLFLMLNIFIFLWGFINLDSIYPLSEAILMAFLFFFILSLQSIFLYSFKKIGLIIAIIFSLGNFYYFNLILNDQSKSTNLIYFFIFLFFYILLNCIKKVKIILFFFSILALSTFITINFKNIFKYEEHFSNKDYSQNTKQIKPNIFFIGIDGMMSTTMYHKYFLSQSPASKMLDSISFSRYDIFSPGQSTLETYAKYFSYKNSFHPRFSYKVINSNSSSFFIETKE